MCCGSAFDTAVWELDDQSIDSDTGCVMTCLSSCCTLLMLPLIIPCISWSHRKTRKEVQRRRDHASGLIPKPLPKPRKRCLTPPPAEGPANKPFAMTLPRLKRQIAPPRRISKFFSLSPELRRMVYQEVFGDVVAYFAIRRHGRAVPLILRVADLEEGEQFCYSEAIDCLYSTSTFKFRSPSSLFYFPITILPQRWNNVRTIQLNCRLASWGLYDGRATWDALWPRVAKMQALKHLHVFFKSMPTELGTSDDRYTRDEEQVFRPMLLATGIQDFVVMVWWPESPWFKSANESGIVPFRVVRNLRGRSAVNNEGDIQG